MLVYYSLFRCHITCLALIRFSRQKADDAMRCDGAVETAANLVLLLLIFFIIFLRNITRIYSSLSCGGVEVV